MKQLIDALGWRMLAPRYRYRLLAIAGAVLLAAGVAVFALPRLTTMVPPSDDISSQSGAATARYHPTESEWANLTVEPVRQQFFGDARTTEGKIAIDEERTTPIFSPYSGRVVEVAGEGRRHGRARSAAVRHRSHRNGARPQRFHDGVRRVEQGARATRTGANGREAQSRSSQRQRHRRCATCSRRRPNSSPRKTISAPPKPHSRPRAIGCVCSAAPTRKSRHFRNPAKSAPRRRSRHRSPGTIVQRKIGPGQYIAAGASDPAFVVGDLSSVWLIAYVRESDTPRISVGQNLKFTVQAIPNQIFSARIDSIAAGLDTGEPPLARARVGREFKRATQAGNARERRDRHRSWQQSRSSCRAAPWCSMAIPRASGSSTTTMRLSCAKSAPGLRMSGLFRCSTDFRRRPHYHQGQPVHRRWRQRKLA